MTLNERIINVDIERMIKSKTARVNKTFNKNGDGEWYRGDAELVLHYGRKISDVRVISVDVSGPDKDYIVEVDYDYQGTGYTLSFMFHDYEYESMSADALPWDDALWGIVDEFELR